MALQHHFFVDGIRIECNIQLDANKCYLDGNGWYLYTDIPKREQLAQVLNSMLETMVNLGSNPGHTYQVLTSVYEGWVGEPMAGKACRADDPHKESNTHRKLVELLFNIYGLRLLHHMHTHIYKINSELPRYIWK